MNIIQKDCPNETCNSTNLDILGAMIIGNESFNYYKCDKCKNNFTVKRTNNEQKLVQKYIDASKITLKK